jgi:hypothetical protein
MPVSKQLLCAMIIKVDIVVLPVQALQSRQLPKKINANSINEFTKRMVFLRDVNCAVVEKNHESTQKKKKKKKKNKTKQNKTKTKTKTKKQKRQTRNEPCKTANRNGTTL